MTRAKMKCTLKTEFEGGFSIELEPVHGDGHKENAEFYKWTPGGSVKLSLVNPETAANFRVGQHYYVDFTEAST